MNCASVDAFEVEQERPWNTVDQQSVEVPARASATITPCDHSLPSGYGNLALAETACIAAGNSNGGTGVDAV